MVSDVEGRIINIQRYSVHDGPGIRTTIFFKGCPLECWWCHNPESQRFNFEIMHYVDKCTACGVCIKQCPEKAISIIDDRLITDYDKCTLCKNCTLVCPVQGREIVGKEVPVEYLFREIEKDEVFYEESGGGVTFSGGEPLNQAEFILKVLKKCKGKMINTAFDTSGYGSWESFEKIYRYVDLFLYDLKLMDDEKHIKYTGVSNKVILDNLKKLAEKNANINIRIPLIVGINDDKENIVETIKFLKSLNITRVNLLPYHKMGIDKYKRINLFNKLTGLERPSETRIQEIVDLFEVSGIKIKVGG